MALKMAYIHMPFCFSKCIYCDFYSETDLSLKKEYLKYLKKEIDLRYKGEKISSIYFGGGTPSLFEPEEIGKIIDKFNKKKNCEITIELNPEDVSLKKINGYLREGINRFSLGVQSLNSFELKMLGRRHNREKAIEAIKILKERVENFSCDLIVGIKGQLKSTIEDNLKELLSFSPPHISVYPLELKEHKYLSEDEDRKAELLEFSWNYLREKGYIHYEISNFAKKGFICKHNLGYWTRNDYYGFGPSAHNLLEKRRFKNTKSVKKYISYLKKGKLLLSNFEILSKDKIKWEEFILILRTNIGYPIENLRKEKLEEFIKYGFLREKGGKIYLTEKGMLVYNPLLIKLYFLFDKNI